MPYILATCAMSSCAVWDLRSNKAWCTLRDQNRGRFSDIAWQPGNPMFLMTATDDDAHPAIRLWDLRSSTVHPVETFMGHRAGVLSMDWSPHGACGSSSHPPFAML